MYVKSSVRSAGRSSLAERVCGGGVPVDELGVLPSGDFLSLAGGRPGLFEDEEDAKLDFLGSLGGM